MQGGADTLSPSRRVEDIMKKEEERNLKIISWNINGLPSTLDNGCFLPLVELRADIICLQEIRTQQEPEILPGYRHYWNHSERDGYFGTAILSKRPLPRVENGFVGDGDTEGRTITIELQDRYIVNVYAPNSQRGLQQKEQRRVWDEAFYNYIQELREDKPVILCGDFNVTRGELDIYEENMRLYWKHQGYLSDERFHLEALLELGLVDVFRERYPDERSYTWWSNRRQKRGENRGWRLDYFLVSEELLVDTVEIRHLADIYGSDHCPILLEVP